MSPVARTTDPSTSHEAAASVMGLTQKQWAVHRVIETVGPMTDQELLDSYRNSCRQNPAWFPLQSESGIRTRRSELVELGFVEFSGTYGFTVGGRRSRVWKAVA